MAAVQTTDVSDKKEGMSAMTKQVLGGFTLMIVGAMFSFLLTSSATQYRLTRAEEDRRTDRAEIEAIKRDLANGGPQPLALRVTRVEVGMEKMQGQVEDIYKVLVLRQPVQK